MVNLKQWEPTNGLEWIAAALGLSPLLFFAVSPTYQAQYNTYILGGIVVGIILTGVSAYFKNKFWTLLFGLGLLSHLVVTGYDVATGTKFT